MPMEQTPVDFPAGRFEHKYLVPDRVAVAIRDALKPHLAVDEHTPEGSVRGYVVYSLYFDTPELDLYRQTREKVQNRFKLRVRFYDLEPSGVAFVEVKEKSGTQIFKRRYATDKGFVEAMLRDPNCDSLLHALGNGARGTALEEFCRRRQELGAKPMVFVAYEREAYNSNTLPLVRITFDRRIKTNPSGPGAGLNVPRYGSNVAGLNVLLEFKYAGQRPEWLADVLKQFRLRRDSFSKFAECLDVLGISGQQPPRHRMGVKKIKKNSA
jgi:hypothetical protein